MRSPCFEIKPMYQRILVPIDGSPTASRGLDEAVELARLSGGSIRLLHVLDQFTFLTGLEIGSTYAPDVLSLLREGGEWILGEGKARVAAAGVAFDTLLLEGIAVRTAAVVVRQAQEWPADLIVIGSHGRRGVRRLMLGSDAEQIVRTATVPVLLVHADETAAGETGHADAQSAADAEAGKTTTAA
ncbi:MAG: universal stress protein [Caldimonas sp.]